MAKSPITIQPWRLEQQEQQSISELLDRVNKERGHFRDIVGSTLQEELAAEGALQLSDDEDDDDEELDNTDNEHKRVRPSTREDLHRAKFEMLQKVSLAHNEVMMALDFISLLESKDSAAGKQTISQVLKENVPAGTLGTDIWQRMPQDNTRVASDLALAHNVRIDALQHSADSLLDAARTLETNVRKETHYWQQILSVTKAGWNVCRLPGQTHKLGVRFGMNESAAEFSRGGIAALNAGEDGSISLDRGIESRPKAVQVIVRHNKAIVGRSRTPESTYDNEAALNTRIKHARDDLFAEELYRELEREARSMSADTIDVRKGAICLTIKDDHDTLDAQFELVSRDEAASARYDKRASKDLLAQGLLSTAKLLLCQAHREQVKRRSTVPAPINDTRSSRPVLPILRPLSAMISHFQSMQAINEYLQILANVLDQAGIETILTLAKLSDLIPGDVDSVDALLSELTSAWSSRAAIEIISPGSSDKQLVSIVMRSSLAYPLQTAFVLTPTSAKERHEIGLDQAYYSLEVLLAAALTTILFAEEHDGWSLSDGAQGLERHGVNGKREPNRLTLDIDGHNYRMSLQGPTFLKQWKLGEQAAQTVWQVWKTIME